MASTVGRETMLVAQSSEFDSECSSGGGGDERTDTRKRLRADDADGSSPKKRRKQTTPVRFPASSLQGGESEEEEEEEEERDADDNGDSESTYEKGKTLSDQARDENLNTEFRCQICGQSFDTKGSLSRHLYEHEGQVRVKIEPQDETEAQLGLNMQNIATSWLSSHAQAQLYPQEPDWSSPNAVSSLPTLPFPGALAQYLPLPAFGLDGQLPRMPVGPAPIRIFNPDAYCDLCNKEFCNKYFLKTHKANKHGIYVDPPSSTGAETNGTVQPTSSIKIEPQRVEVLPMVCEVCQKRFKNEDSLRKHRQKAHETPEPESLAVPEEEREVYRGSPSSMEALMRQEMGVEQEDSKFLPAPRHLSPQSSQQARECGFNVDGLRRLGVINPDAFCEICCKEYCNKYFLRTHKMKRHGIQIPDDDKSPTSGESGNSWHHIQTSPLNLIVTEHVPEVVDSKDEVECHPCDLRFRNLQLYKTHISMNHQDDDEAKSPKVDSDDVHTDSISEDLQKLQTMILQLNTLETSSTLTCGICGCECENSLTLKTHIALEHAGSLNDESSSPPQALDNPMPSAYCMICDKDLRNPEALRQHVAEEHSTTNSTNPTTISLAATTTPVPTALPQLQPPPIPPPPDKKLSSMTPTSSYCEICNKELCNKYFMKTHMQRMHGIEIENGSQIGGVICNICNKELCSKYFLRVHKQNTHGIVDESTSTSKQENYEQPSTDEAQLKADNFGDLSHRYFTHFTEVCPVCSRRFRSIKWLKAHLLGDHGKAGLDKWRELEQHYQNAPKNRSGASSASRTTQQNPNLKIPNSLEVNQHLKSDYPALGNQVLSSLFGEEPQTKNYRCSYCNFSTTVLPFLFLHERSHTNNPENMNPESGLQCPICSQAFPQPELLHHHLLTRHQFSGLLSQFQPHSQAPQVDGQEVFEQKDVEAKDERVLPSPQVEGNKAKEIPAVEVTPQGAYRCAQCGLATANLNRIKKHVKKDHKSLGDPVDSVIDELSKTLRDVANKHKLPASYAMPQDMNSNPDATVMQPFIIEERDCEVNSDESRLERRFVPALIYLPVRARVSSALTTSFTLSPA